MSYGAVVFAENPTTLMEASDFHGYELDGLAGGNITITMNASVCGNPDTVIDLFGPEDANGNRAFLIENDDTGVAPCTLDSKIANFTLPVTGRYLVVGTSFLQQGGNGHYKLQVTCNNNACVDPTAPTFATSQIAQTDIDAGKFTPAQLFDIGDFTFEHIFRVEEGMGNALNGAPANITPRPNFRPFPNNVHFAAFGAPEAQSCVTCHNLGGDDGAGDVNHNIFQIGDGINRSSGVPRNPPALLGNGYRQRIGEEMTTDLQAELASAKANAASTHVAVTQALTSKGISFGSLVANADGTVNFAGVVGVDTDLIIKPFGWKGREATLRRFIESSFRVHFGMQASPSIAKNCAAPNVNTFGNGSNCQDPDGDGVTNEISEGHLSAEAIYMGLREVPVRVPAIDAAAQARANSGEALFNQIGCFSCHRQNMTANSPIHTEKADTTGGAGITLNLSTDNNFPHPAINANGSITIEVFSDFKRHDVGTALADSKNFNQIAANQFITPPLWGIADSAPYLHDGRAPTLADAILQHAGDALAVRNAYAALSADDQLQVQEFLLTLGRQEDKDAGPVDLSNFIIEQQQVVGTTTSFIDVFLPAGTTVPRGGFLIIARSATQAQFEAFYGKTLGPNVRFFTGGNAFPQIDGSETFAVFDPQGVFIDGRSFPETATGQQTLQRISCGAVAPLAGSWKIATTTTAGATPGSGPLSTGQNRICVSEVTDATNSSFEYVEIFVEGHGGTSGSAPTDAATCKKLYGFKPSTSGADTLLTSKCPPSGCGLNGFWLGANVPFRTLHLDPNRANEANLSILDAWDDQMNPLEIDVQGDVLSGRPASDSAAAFKPAKPGWRLSLGEWVVDPTRVVASKVPEYTLYIQDVINNNDTLFWAQPDGRFDTFTKYKFLAVSADGCEIEVCNPELSNNNLGISGEAIIFRGDLYNDNYTVQSSPSDPANYNSDTFNIACLGTTLSKLHRLRHTAASQTPQTDPAVIPTLRQRQTLLKLLAADYCGDGIPFTRDSTPLPFTINGLPIGLEFANSYYKLTPESGYSIAPSSIDALWNEYGATCIDNPRLLEAIKKGTVTGTGPDLDAIQNACGKQFLSCSSAVLSPTANYAKSENP